MAEFDRSKYVEVSKYFSKTEKRYINVQVYEYDNNGIKLSMIPATKNTNSNADANKKWIKGKGISGLTKEEAQALVTALNNAISKMP